MTRYRVAGAVSSAVFGLALAARAAEPAANVAADSNTVVEAPTTPTTGISSTPTAQEAAATVPASQWYGDARIIGLIATAFGNNPDGPGIGFGVAVNVGHGHIPLTVGIDVTTVYLGTQTSQTQVRTGDTLVALDRSREDLAYLLDTSLRFAPLDGWFRPYLEGVLGAKLLQTKYSLSFPD
ncbi:MAG TPA: hypothetical protein VHW01_24780, partial [Polyangiaceae bacterium]|nr:hypothetical protein [Polyangiaceae bacterium]